MPDRMTVDRDENGRLYYEYIVSSDDAPINKNSIVRLQSFDVLHIPGLGFDGLVGYSPIAMAKNSIGMAIACEEYGSKFFANGAAPSGVLEHPGTIKDPSRVGFDFDVNIEVNDDDEDYTAADIRNKLRNAITKVSRNYGFTKCEDSTRVITIKKANRWYSTIEHSCDFAVVYGSQYIRYNKGSQKYSWELQSKGYINTQEFHRTGASTEIIKLIPFPFTAW